MSNELNNENLRNNFDVFKSHFNNFCVYLLNKCLKLDEINNRTLGAYKRHHSDSYDFIKTFFEDNLTTDNLVPGLSAIFQLYGVHLINNNTYSILNSLLANRFGLKITNENERKVLETILNSADDSVRIDNPSQLDLCTTNLVHTDENDISDNDLLDILLDLNDTKDNHYTDCVSTNSNNNSNIMALPQRKNHRNSEINITKITPPSTTIISGSTVSTIPLTTSSLENPLNTKDNAKITTSLSTDNISLNANKISDINVITSSTKKITFGSKLVNRLNSSLSILGSRFQEHVKPNSQHQDQLKTNAVTSNIINNSLAVILSNNKNTTDEVPLQQLQHHKNSSTTTTSDLSSLPQTVQNIPKIYLDTIQQKDQQLVSKNAQFLSENQKFTDSIVAPNISNIQHYNSSQLQLNSNIEHLITKINGLPDLVDKQINKQLNLKINDLKNEFARNEKQQQQSKKHEEIQNIVNSHNDKEELIRDLTLLIKKVLKTENNINILNSHLKNKTTPKSLNHHRFPKPFLSHNENYVSSYNDLVEKFQADIIKFNLDELERNKIQLIDKVKIIKTKIIESNYFENISKLITNIYRKCEADLSKIFLKSDKKVKNAIVNRFTVKKIIFNDSNDSMNFSCSSNNSNVITITDSPTKESTNLTTNNQSQKEFHNIPKKPSHPSISNNKIDDCNNALISNGIYQNKFNNHKFSNYKNHFNNYQNNSNYHNNNINFHHNKNNSYRKRDDRSLSNNRFNENKNNFNNHTPRNFNKHHTTSTYNNYNIRDRSKINNNLRRFNRSYENRSHSSNSKSNNIIRRGNDIRQYGDNQNNTYSNFSKQPQHRSRR